MSLRACLLMCSALSLIACSPRRANKQQGKAAVTATVASCPGPVILGIEASPLEVTLGSELLLSAKLAYPSAAIVWHADGGVFRSRRAAITRFRCDLPGVHTVIVNVLGSCRERASVRVTCTESLTCGDGQLDFGEQCDDGDTADGDGCSQWCVVEPSGAGGHAGSGG